MYVLSNNVKICIYMTYKLLKIKGYIYTVFWKSYDYCKKKKYRLCNRHNCAENTCIAEILKPTVFINCPSNEIGVMSCIQCI